MCRAEIFSPAVLLLLMAAQPGQAFRNCQIDGDSAAYRGSSAYLVGEIAYEAASGLASGTETHYTFSNAGPAGLSECHVTYELNGIYDEASALLVLDAQRTNQSRSCEPDLIDARFPDYRSYSMSLRQSPEGLTELVDAASGLVLANGDPSGGALLYRTDESCALE